MESNTRYVLTIIEQVPNPKYAPPRPRSMYDSEPDRQHPQYFERQLEVTLTHAQMEEVKKAVMANWDKTI